jgi:hypothetical protein
MLSKTWIIFAFVGILLFSLTSSYDTQTTDICGGDSETIIGCPIGDNQTFKDFQYLKEDVGEIKKDGFFDIDTTTEKMLVYLLVFLIVISLVIIYLKLRRR